MAKYSVKGTAITSVRDWVDEALEPGTFHRFASELDSEWPNRILPSEWYPIRPMVRALQPAIDELGRQRSFEEVCEEISAVTAVRDLNSIYRAFLWAASPRMFLRTVPRIWSSYADFASLRGLENEPGSFRVTVEGVPEDLVEWACGVWKGFLPPALDLAGAEQATAKVVDRRMSEDGTTWEFDYELRYS